VRTLYARLTTPALAGGAREDGVDAWLWSRSPKGLSRTEQGISIPLTHAHADRDPVRGLYARLTTPALAGGAREDGVDAWLDKAKLFPGQDWEL